VSHQSQHIVGRAAEIGYLEQCLEAALGGERQVVFVSGEPGIGKTTLVDAFLERLASSVQRLASKELQPLAIDQTLDPRLNDSRRSIPNPQSPIPILISRGHCIEQYGSGEAYLPLLEVGTRLCQEPDGEQAIALLRQYAPTWLVQLPGVIPEAEWEQLQRRTQGAT
jgi:predicted ATPase